MLDQPSKHTGKSKPGWRFVKLFRYSEAPSAGPSKGTGNRTPKEPEERKHQFATWYIFAAFLGLMLVQFLWLRFTQIDTIPYSQFEQLLDENKIAEVLVGPETVQGTLKEPFPDGRKEFYTVRVRARARRQASRPRRRHHRRAIVDLPLHHPVLRASDLHLLPNLDLRVSPHGGAPGSRRPDVDR